MATHERPELLASALTTLAKQTRAVDEIVISDSSLSSSSGSIVESFMATHRELDVKYVRSVKRALPWQRWWAMQHSTGEVILFLDDDVSLDPSAIELLARTYDDLSTRGGEKPAGVGFMMTWEDGEQPVRDPHSLKERWVGTARWPSGHITTGGLGVSAAGLRSEHPVPVEQLWGGAMSFPKDVLDRVGLLDELVSLYEEGIGRAEDGVLSFCARQHGRLYIISKPVALHPREAKAANVPIPYARNGWRMGLTGTWGRAHTMRWLASNQGACIRQWLLIASLECGRCFLEILKRPLRSANWERLAGAVFGTTRALVKWHTIPPAPRSEQEISKGKSDSYELAG
ncbi:MAG TPA: glycosyltransferase [Pyrinomonadaceae bacterium]|nr:glycosyltransferase [Pyrinomonadaceae bacterium]